MPGVTHLGRGVTMIVTTLGGGGVTMTGVNHFGGHYDRCMILSDHGALSHSLSPSPILSDYDTL
jgi:hypothetical protein